MDVYSVDPMWFLPSFLKIKVKLFNQERVNDVSKYDYLNVAEDLII